MGFVKQECFVGSDKSAQMVLVTFANEHNRLPRGRGNAFLSRDGGQSFCELFVHDVSKTSHGHAYTLLIPLEGDEFYVTKYHRTGDDISFVDKTKPVTHHALRKGDTVSMTSVTRLTDAQMAEIVELRKLMGVSGGSA